PAAAGPVPQGVSDPPAVRLPPPAGAAHRPPHGTVHIRRGGLLPEYHGGGDPRLLPPPGERFLPVLRAAAVRVSPGDLYRLGRPGGAPLHEPSGRRRPDGRAEGIVGVRPAPDPVHHHP